MEHAEFTRITDLLAFIRGGRATLTIRSERTGTRYTYRVATKRDDDGTSPYFVSVLSGPENSTDYTYLGFIPRTGELDLFAGRKGHRDAPSFKALQWLLRRLGAGTLDEVLGADVRVWHEGKCCRCGRKLTTPESVALGIGPECAKRADI